MNISTYLSNALLNHSLGVAPYIPPTTVWAGLYTVAPTAAGGGTEVINSDYARVASSWGAAANEQITDSANIRFPASGNTSSNWGIATYLGLFDSLTVGNLLYFGALSAPITLGVGTNFLIAPGSLVITLS